MRMYITLQELTLTLYDTIVSILCRCTTTFTSAGADLSRPAAA